MKLVPEDELKHGRVKSEGKLLEVIPIVTDATGQPMMLPPLIWQVPNFVLGYEDWHPISMPVSFYMNDRLHIPGSNASQTHTLTFLVRMMEDSAIGAMVAHVDTEAVAALIQAVRESVNRYN
jgi:hypothetical protein